MWPRNAVTLTGIETDAATAAIRALNSKRYAGFVDWRLPTIEELASLLSAGRSTLRSSGERGFVDDMLDYGFCVSRDRVVPDGFDPIFGPDTLPLGVDYGVGTLFFGHPPETVKIPEACAVRSLTAAELGSGGAAPR
jgi:hypothetical protein